jgi:hypothetical protein
MVAYLPAGAFERVGTYGDRVAARALPSATNSSPVEVGAIVFLSGFGPRFELSKVEPSVAITDLWFLSFHLPTDSDRERKFVALVDMAQNTPIYRLTQPRDPKRLPEAVDRLAQIIKGSN